MCVAVPVPVRAHDISLHVLAGTVGYRCFTVSLRFPTYAIIDQKGNHRHIAEVPVPVLVHVLVAGSYL